MNDFKPWRRRIGVVTLILSCVLMAGWVRNNSVRDSVNVPTGTSSALQFISGDGCVNVVALWTSLPDQEMASFRFYRHEHEDGVWLHAGKIMLAGDPSEFHPTWHHFKMGDQFTTSMTFSIPYWSIVISLTILTAYLLLSRSRTAGARVSFISTTNAGSV